jgi:thioredoxin reductase
VYHYPRNKIVATQPIVLPLVGKMKLGEVSKESLLEFWQGIVERTRMQIRFQECVKEIIPEQRGFVVDTGSAQYHTRSVLLAIGRRGTPRKLGVPGEELPKVVYRLVDSAQYRGRRVLVVGGGDSAVEAAVALATEPEVHVTLAYRGEAFNRIRPKNRERLNAAERSGRVTLMTGSAVVRVEEQHVVLDRNGQATILGNDAVIVCAGGVLPTPMLKEIGVEVETKYGTA